MLLPRGAAAVGSPPLVTRLDLITCAEAEALLDTSLTGTPRIGEDAPVWYVELQGTFSLAHVSRPSRVNLDGIACTAAMLVLDAESGEVLVRALGPHDPQTEVRTDDDR